MMKKLSDNFIMVHCTCPTQDVAEEIASQVISNSLAGCVNILPNLCSVYRWQGKIEKTMECLLLIKTIKEYCRPLEQLIKKLHPYQVPEIITLPINYGSSEYLKWLQECLNS